MASLSLSLPSPPGCLVPAAFPSPASLFQPGSGMCHLSLSPPSGEIPGHRAVPAGHPPGLWVSAGARARLKPQTISAGPVRAQKARHAHTGGGEEALGAFRVSSQPVPVASPGGDTCQGTRAPGLCGPASFPPAMGFTPSTAAVPGCLSTGTCGAPSAGSPQPTHLQPRPRGCPL